VKRGASFVNPFDDQRLANRYEDWYEGPGRHADRCEKTLLGELLADFPDCINLLDIGCGTGHFTRWFAARGLTAAGLDLSRPMLAEAVKRNGQVYVRGDALKLPFQDGSFDLVSAITILEFLPDPACALAEAIRVARRGILLGALNRWSLQAARRRRSDDSIWRAAHFFSPFELIRLVRRAAGNRLEGVRWRTTLCPVPFLGSLPMPFGGFIGLAARISRQP
jgi:SAM-dependent methyltransferase